MPEKQKSEIDRRELRKLFFQVAEKMREECRKNRDEKSK
ncbi:MAG: hypothetical protein XD50_1119 [Clostridia bacterium 41_269]|nr:MAG: hypothetical protein XD50_1119 [Clostridia bacterium 41_269]